MVPPESLYEQLSKTAKEKYREHITSVVLFMLKNAHDQLPAELAFLIGQTMKASLNDVAIDPKTVAGLYQAWQTYDTSAGFMASMYNISASTYALPSTMLIYMLVDARNRVNKSEIIEYIDANMQLSAKERAGRTDSKIMQDVVSAAVGMAAGTATKAASLLVTSAYNAAIAGSTVTKEPKTKLSIAKKPIAKKPSGRFPNGNT